MHPKFCYKAVYSICILISFLLIFLKKKQEQFYFLLNLFLCSTQWHYIWIMKMSFLRENYFRWMAYIWSWNIRISEETPAYLYTTYFLETGIFLKWFVRFIYQFISTINFSLWLPKRLLRYQPRLLDISIVNFLDVCFVTI